MRGIVGREWPNANDTQASSSNKKCRIINPQAANGGSLRLPDAKLIMSKWHNLAARAAIAAAAASQASSNTVVSWNQALGRVIVKMAGEWEVPDKWAYRLHRERNLGSDASAALSRRAITRRQRKWCGAGIRRTIKARSAHLQASLPRGTNASRNACAFSLLSIFPQIYNAKNAEWVVWHALISVAVAHSMRDALHLRLFETRIIKAYMCGSRASPGLRRCMHCCLRLFNNQNRAYEVSKAYVYVIRPAYIIASWHIE